MYGISDAAGDTTLSHDEQVAMETFNKAMRWSTIKGIAIALIVVAGLVAIYWWQMKTKKGAS